MSHPACEVTIPSLGWAGGTKFSSPARANSNAQGMSIQQRKERFHEIRQHEITWRREFGKLQQFSHALHSWASLREFVLIQRSSLASGNLAQISLTIAAAHGPLWRRSCNDFRTSDHIVSRMATALERLFLIFLWRATRPARTPPK